MKKILLIAILLSGCTKTEIQEDEQQCNCIEKRYKVELGGYWSSGVYVTTVSEKEIGEKLVPCQDLYEYTASGIKYKLYCDE